MAGCGRWRRCGQAVVGLSPWRSAVHSAACVSTMHGAASVLGRDVRGRSKRADASDDEADHPAEAGPRHGGGGWRRASKRLVWLPAGGDSASACWAVPHLVPLPVGRTHRVGAGFPGGVAGRYRKRRKLPLFGLACQPSWV